MITTIFKKSTTINYILVSIMAIMLFFVYQINITKQSFSTDLLLQKFALLLIFLASIFITDFITKKNDFSKDNSFTVFFYLFFIIFFPSILNNINLLIANLAILLAIRRLVSMSKTIDTKQKIFDASLWIFIASLFYFWSILFIIMIFISIIIDASNDYKNWLIPIVGFLCVGIIFVFFAFLIDKSLIFSFINSISVDYNFLYFKNIYQNISFSLFITAAICFCATFLVSFSHKPMINNSAYKKLFIWFLTGFVIFIISNNKNNEILLFTIAPLSIIATDYVEENQIRWQKDVVFLAIILAGFFSFITQL